MNVHVAPMKQAEAMRIRIEIGNMEMANHERIANNQCALYEEAQIQRALERLRKLEE